MDPKEHRRGVMLGASAYLMWGLFPLYWPLLKPAGALEILAHRVVWSLAVVLLLLAVTGRLGWLRGTPGRKLGWLTLAAVLVSFNWLLYIWAVNAGHVVETSLGYFINPLISVLLGVMVLGERLRRVQWMALGGAALAVVVLGIDHGRPPWIALGLAPSFALYGLVRKHAGIGGIESLSFETLVLMLPAVGYLLFLEQAGTGSFGHVGWASEALLVGAGVMTAVPLVCFGAAALRVPLSTLGVLQYIAPSLQFLCGVAVFREQMSTLRWTGFGLIWACLAVFALEGVVQLRRNRLNLATAR